MYWCIAFRELFKFTFLKSFRFSNERCFLTILTTLLNKLEESKAAVAGGEESNFRRRIREALEILSQSPTLNRDRGFELPARYGDVLACDLVHPSSRD